MNFKTFIKSCMFFYFCASVYLTSFASVAENNIDPGDIVARITYLEEKIRFLNGKVEELEYLKQEVDKKFEEFEKNSKELIAGLQASILKQAATPPKTENTETLKKNENITEPKKIGEPLKNDLAMQKYTNITNLLNTKKYDLAEKEMLSFVKEFSKNSLTAKIYYMLGELKYNKGLFEAASLQYLYCQKNFPKSEYTPKALYKLSLCLEKIKKYSEMCAALNKILKEYPTADTKIVEFAKNKQIKQQCAVN